MNNGAGVYRLVIDYDPVSQQLQFQSTAPNDITVVGMLELARSAVIQRQVAMNAGGPRVVVPSPNGVS